MNFVDLLKKCYFLFNLIINQYIPSNMKKNELKNHLLFLHFKTNILLYKNIKKIIFYLIKYILS